MADIVMKNEPFISSVVPRDAARTYLNGRPYMIVSDDDCDGNTFVIGHISRIAGDLAFRTLDQHPYTTYHCPPTLRKIADLIDVHEAEIADLKNKLTLSDI